MILFCLFLGPTEYVLQWISRLWVYQWQPSPICPIQIGRIFKIDAALSPPETPARTGKHSNINELQIVGKYASTFQIVPTDQHHSIAFLRELKVSKFRKQIFLFSFEPKKRTKLFFDFCPKDLKQVNSKNKGIYYVKQPLVNIIKCLPVF